MRVEQIAVAFMESMMSAGTDGLIGIGLLGLAVALLIVNGIGDKLSDIFAFACLAVVIALWSFGCGNGENPPPEPGPQPITVNAHLPENGDGGVSQPYWVETPFGDGICGVELTIAYEFGRAKEIHYYNTNATTIIAEIENLTTKGLPSRICVWAKKSAGQEITLTPGDELLIKVLRGRATYSTKVVGRC